VFNRPDITEKSFEQIRRQEPPLLFLIADGPRLGHSTDQARCEEVRDIVRNIDWPCEVHQNFSEVNQGAKQRVSSGLDWVFSIVDRATILEDDCVAHPDFFLFCNELLERFDGDERVSGITGNNFQNGQKRGEHSYYFSKYLHVWGWATWRRAWDFYQADIDFWPGWRGSEDWKQQMPDTVERRYEVPHRKVSAWSDLVPHIF
jgi:hypothetical protein